MLYRQCKLRKGNIIDVAWIPARYAVKGKFLKIKGDNGWEVVLVGAVRDEQDARTRERDYLKTRIATDI